MTSSVSTTTMAVPSRHYARATCCYLPRPEWYFLFLFKFLAIYGQIPVINKIEWIAAFIVPAVAIGLLFLMPFIDRSPARHQSKRLLPLTIMAYTVVSIITLTLIANVPTTGIPGKLQVILGLILPAATLLLLILLRFLLKGKAKAAMLWTTGISSLLMIALTVATLVLAPARVAEETTTIAGTLSEQILVGQDLYSVHCAECHGAEGEGGEMKGVEGFDGVILDPLANTDVMYTYTDDALVNVISYGQQESDPAMTPFGRAYGGELGPGDIDAIVTFMRYTWDYRVELLLDVLAASAMPTLAEGEPGTCVRQAGHPRPRRIPVRLVRPAAGQGWLSLLERRLGAQGYEYRLVNASVSGETTVGGLERLPRALEKHRPAIVILELGANDGLRGLPVAEIEANLESMVEMSRKAGARVLLTGIRIPTNYGPRYTEQFFAVYGELAGRHKLALVPFFLEGIGLDESMFQEDGIHPGVEAQPVLLDNLWPALQPLLKR